MAMDWGNEYTAAYKTAHTRKTGGGGGDRLARRSWRGLRRSRIEAEKETPAYTTVTVVETFSFSEKGVPRRSAQFHAREALGRACTRAGTEEEEGEERGRAATRERVRREVEAGRARTVQSAAAAAKQEGAALCFVRETMAPEGGNNIAPSSLSLQEMHHSD